MDKPEIDSDKVKDVARRGMWLFMALLFVVTGLGVGIYAFWQATHQTNSQTNSSQNQPALACANDAAIQFNSPQNGQKLAGQQLADFTPTAHIASLSCIDAKLGSGGQAVQSSSTITANYTGAVAATGKIFQSSLDTGQPFSTALSGVIAGWQQGLTGMRAGGERRLLIPANLAYGANPPAGAGIPANAGLVFDISIIAVQ